MEWALSFLSAWSEELIAGGTLAAATVAAIGLLLTHRSISQQAKSVDVQTALRLFFAIRQSERDLHKIENDTDRMRFYLVEHCNFLDLLAQSHNSKSLTRQAADICKDFLLNHLVVIEANEQARAILQESVTSSETFVDLAAFYHKHKRQLERRRQEILKSQQYLPE